MTILKGDIKLVKSEVMDDVPEGGGGPTAAIVVDGASNEIFRDISESDRAAGRVSLRKLHVWVQSTDTDAYLGANVIIAKPPNDPNTSVTLFTTNDVFDRRTDAIARIEAYLSVGGNYAGFLAGNHIEGQATLTLFQRTDELPPIGGTLALTQREGFNNQRIQYVRITEVKATLRTFTDTQGDFQRWILELKLSDPLRFDLLGFDVTRIDPTRDQLALFTKISDVVVADAARYYGVTPLVSAAAINDFSVVGESVFTQLVPSAQIETPIADARVNQTTAAVLSGGGPVTLSIFGTLTPTQNLFIGGAVAPGSLTVSRDGATITDNGGRLFTGGAQVGLVDYANGLLSVTSAVFGEGGGTFSIVYTPASAVEVVTQSQGFEITAENRSLSYVRTIEPAPERGSLSISYRAQGRWYVLRDDGSGALRGTSTAYGAGQVNFQTGTISTTLGALPDVGSALIYSWVQPESARTSDVLALENDGRLYWPFNTDGLASEVAGSKSVTPGQVGFSWRDSNDILRTVTDDGFGRLQGDATGTVNYAQGTFRISPTELPAPGTQMTLNTDLNVRITQPDRPVVANNGNFGVTSIKPGTITAAMDLQVSAKYAAGPWVPIEQTRSYKVVDDSAGKLQIELFSSYSNAYFAYVRIDVGTVDYSTGDFTLLPNIEIPWDSNPGVEVPGGVVQSILAYDNIYLNTTTFMGVGLTSA